MSASSLSWENLPPFFFKPRLAKTRNHSQLVLGMLIRLSVASYELNVTPLCLLLFVDGIAQPVLNVRPLFLIQVVPYFRGHSQGIACQV